MNMTVVYVILGVIGGYLFALLDRWVTGKFRKPRPEPAPAPAPQAAPAPQPDAPSAPDLPPPSGPPDGLRLGRARDGATFLEVDGLRVTPATISADQRRRLIALMTQIRPYIDASEPVPPPPAVQAAAPVRPITAPRPTGPARLDLSRGLRNMIEDSVIDEETNGKPATIVGQIDQVLQEMLQARGATGAAIRLMEGPSGEVLVYIGAQRYPGIDAVPDENAKAIIRAAVAEWEKTSGD